MALITIVCIDPQNQDEKVKIYFNHMISSLIFLVRNFKNKLPEKKEFNAKEDKNDNENVKNNFNVNFYFSFYISYFIFLIIKFSLMIWTFKILKMLKLKM